MSVLVLTLAGGRGARLGPLCEQRAKPVLPMAGKYRLIDFVLSNLVNSYLTRIAVLTQFSSHSLIEHLGTGEPWNLHQHVDGLQIWQPYLGRTEQPQYTGTADAVYQNRRFIREEGSDTILIVSGDHLYHFDFRELIRYHQQKHADLTIATMQVDPGEGFRYGMMDLQADGRIQFFVEKPEMNERRAASMGIYVFNTATLLHYLEEDARDPASHHDFGNDLIPELVRKQVVYGYPFSGVWHDIGDIPNYMQANLAMTGENPPVDFYDPDWPVRTRSAQRPPVWVQRSALIEDSLVSSGCVIQGSVIHSVLSPGVRVEPGAVVRDSVVLQDGIIRSGAQVNGCLLDEQVEVGEGARLGIGDDLTPNSEYSMLAEGTTLAGMRAVIPANAQIGRNCVVSSDARPGDFLSRELPSGGTIRRG